MVDLAQAACAVGYQSPGIPLQCCQDWACPSERFMWGSRGPPSPYNKTPGIQPSWGSTLLHSGVFQGHIFCEARCLPEREGNVFYHWSQSSGVGSVSMLALGSSCLHISIPLDPFRVCLAGPHTYTEPKHALSAVRERTTMLKMNNILMPEATHCTVAAYAA